MRTEIIPLEPDAVSTAEGKSDDGYLLFLQPFLKHNLFLGMEITINNQLRSIAADSVTVQHVLDLEIPKRQKGIAVAVNNVIVPKGEWESYPVLSQDKIVIIKATQGG